MGRAACIGFSDPAGLKKSWRLAFISPNTPFGIFSLM